MSTRIKERLAEVAPEFSQLAHGELAPPTSAILTSDGRVARSTPHGLEWVEILPRHTTDAVFTFAREIAHGQESFSLRDPDGAALSGFLPAHGEAQIKLAFAPSRRYTAKDFASSLPTQLFSYLEALVRLGETIWIVGDTGFEFDLGVALAPADHTLLVRPPNDRPAPFRASSLGAHSSLEDAMTTKELGGFGTLVYAGDLDARALDVCAQRSGIVLTQRATSVERALRRAGILQREETAQQLLAIGAVVRLTRSASGGALVHEIAEPRPDQSGVAYTIFASRGAPEDPTALSLIATPEGLHRIAAAGAPLPIALTDQQEDDSDEVVIDEPALPDDDDDAEFEGADPPRVSLDDLHEDPGWELDAAAEQGLVAAPGDEGKSGMFRARPVVRPSAPPMRGPELVSAGGEGAADAEEDGLTLDAPRRRIIIPEAPTSLAQKRTFKEIMKERHRFPPVSENGPTLTPPVLRNANGGFEDEDDGGEPREEEDITP